MLTTTEAIVIKSMKYRDSSKIVTFYTRRYGKLKGVAKGSRQSKNKFGAALEPMSYVSLVLYRKEHQDLSLVSQCDAIQSFGTIQMDMDRLSVGLSVLELVDQLAHEQEENEALFTLIVRTLGALELAPKQAETLFRAFQIQIASLFGFAPTLDICRECGRSMIDVEDLGSLAFHHVNGAVLCSNCRKEKAVELKSGYSVISPSTFQILRRFLNGSTEGLSNLSYNERVGNELDETLRLYLRSHFEHLKPIKSLQMFKSGVSTRF
jgi:DNA repair protein RecO (recombination protein O)